MAVGRRVKRATFRLVYRLMLFRVLILRILGWKAVRSPYSFWFAANYDDATFKFYVTGAYGNFYWDRLSRYNRQFVFLDIGANQGLYTLTAANNPFCVVAYAFEPVPDTYHLLQKNITLNSLSSKCIPVQKAIASKTGFDEIVLSENHSGAATLSAKNQLSGGAQNTVTIETIDWHALELLITEVNVDVLIKIDVEGFEETVLSQLVKTEFFRNAQEVFIEIDEAWTNAKNIENLLRADGFTQFKRVGTDKNHYDLLALRRNELVQ